MATTNPAASGANAANQAVDELSESVSILNEAFYSIGVTIKNELLQNVRGTTDEMEAQRATIKDISNTMANMARQSQRLLGIQGNIEVGEGSSRDVAKQMLKVKLNEQKVLSQLKTARRQGLITDLQLAVKRNEIKEKTQEELDIYKELYKVVKKREQTEDRLKKSMDGYMKVVNRMQRIPFLGSLIDASHVQQKMNKYAEDYKAKTGKTASAWKTLGVGIQSTFESIGKSLLNPFTWLTAIASIVTTIIKMVLEWEQTTYDIAKSIGTTVSQAERLRGVFQGMTGAALVSKEVAESYGQIIDQLGFMGPATDAFAGTAAKMQKRLAASADAMAGLARAGAMSNMQLNKAYATVVGYAKVSGAKNKLALTERQIMGEISKVSNDVLINFRGNLPALAEAVVRAKKLGTTLEQVTKTGDSLLDFESSIAAEFEAQVITGENINMTRARDLALHGKTAELMEEINSMGMTSAKFENMNLIQRDAYAKLLGRSREELSKQLVDHELAVNLGAKEGQALTDRYNQLIKENKSRKEIAAMIGTSAEAELNRASTAERIEATFTRIKEQLASMVAGPVLDLVNLGLKWLSNTDNIKMVAGFIKGLFEKIRDVARELPSYLNTAITVLKVIAAYSIGSAVANIVAGLSMSGPVGVALGLVAGGAAYTWLSGLMPGFGGGGSGAPAVSGGSSNVVIDPYNKAKTSEVERGISSKAGETNKPVVIENKMYIDGQPVAVAASVHNRKVPQRFADGNTAKG